MEKFLAFGEYQGLNYDELVHEITVGYEVEKEVVETYKILVASYDCGSYEGEGYILLQNKNTSEFFEIHSSHCSCYGLEGQFQVEPVELKYIYSKYYSGSGNAELIREFLISEIRKSKIDTIIKE